ncbi:MAG: endo,4-beta-xylanase precursor [Herbinix sp.]|jgi:hypothetical protein|nr:endo,4-beta-xylanase precursor [Herbinix sp.]
MKRQITSIILIIVLFSSLLLPSTVTAKQYTIKDVTDNDEAYEAIQDVLNQGWMSLTLSKFYPDKYVTRGEFAMILTKFNGQQSEVSKIKKVSFVDVKIDDQYGKYIELQKKYLTYYNTKSGYYFKPKKYLTREDALVAIVKALGYDSDKAMEEGVYSEIDLNEIIEDYDKVSPSLEKYMNIGVVNELIDLVEVDDKTYLNPKKYITRRQMAQLLVNAQDCKEFNIEEERIDEIITDDDAVIETEDTQRAPTMTPVPTPTPTIKPTQTLSPTPTIKPTQTLSPTPSPTPTITTIVTPTPTLAPTYTPAPPSTNTPTSMPTQEQDIVIQHGGDTLTLPAGTPYTITYNEDGSAKVVTSNGNVFILGN